MRYFTLCLYTEGPSDRYFFERILWRTLVDYLSKLNFDSEVQEQFIRFPRKPSNVSRKEYILDQVKNLHNKITIIFAHTDGGSDPAAARENSCVPALHKINFDYPNICGVAVVPVREMESWALADEAAIREAAGFKTYKSSEKNPERIADPKKVISELIERSRSLTVESILYGIADIMELRELRRLSSFKQFEGELTGQLQRMGVK